MKLLETISLPCYASKILERMIFDKLHLNDKNEIEENQFGLREKIYHCSSTCVPCFNPLRTWCKNWKTFALVEKLLHFDNVLHQSLGELPTIGDYKFDFWKFIENSLPAKSIGEIE